MKCKPAKGVKRQEIEGIVLGIMVEAFSGGFPIERENPLSCKEPCWNHKYVPNRMRTSWPSNITDDNPPVTIIEEFVCTKCGGTKSYRN